MSEDGDTSLFVGMIDQICVGWRNGGSARIEGALGAATTVAEHEYGPDVDLYSWYQRVKTRRTEPDTDYQAQFNYLTDSLNEWIQKRREPSEDPHRSKG